MGPREGPTRKRRTLHFAKPFDWVRQIGCGIPVVFHSDSLTSVDFVVGRSFPTSCCCLAQSLRSGYSSLPSYASIGHVYAHAGNSPK